MDPEQPASDMNFTIFHYFYLCFNLPTTNHLAIAFNLINVPFVLPLCLYILHLGAQQWRNRAKISHTDFFTYNMVVNQLIGILGSCLLTGNQIFGNKMVTVIGICMLLVNSSSILFFQVITCLERYMAVVHPVTYLNLKSQTWTLIRNLKCALVWLQCTIQSIYLGQSRDFDKFFFFSLVVFSLSLLLVMFCNLRIVLVLMRPRPGDGATGNKSKQKTLYMITAISGALLVKFGGDLLSVLSFFFISHSNDIDTSCGLYFSVMWFNLPSTLVLPLLFLHRNGKLWCFKTNKAQVVNKN